MRFTASVLVGMLASSLSKSCRSSFLPLYLDSQQYKAIPTYQAAIEGVGHFSEWSKATKRDFVDDVRAGKTHEWVIVMGNEGGDLDSMTAALTWAYHLSHLPEPALNGSQILHSHSKKAIALLQTPRDALDLRPENKLALRNVQMSPGHRDLLTIDELPLPATELAEQVKGIILVDHPAPRSVWIKAKILSIFDHHKDRGVAPDAKPRLFEGTASCTTIVAREMLDELESLPKEYHMPHEVVELILDAIALDSDGLNKATTDDRFTARRLLKRSNWKHQKLLDVMNRLDEEMSIAKKDLESLGVRDLLRRDWKGDMVKTKSKEHPQLNLGLASIPYSLDDQIKRTLHETTQSWFAIEEAWAQELQADVSLSLNSYKVRVNAQDNLKSESMKITSTKIREICLVVRPSERLSEEAADHLFATLKSAISDSPFLDAVPWHSVDQLKSRQFVFVHHQAGRKLIRPILEEAVTNWSYP